MRPGAFALESHTLALHFARRQASPRFTVCVKRARGWAALPLTFGSETAAARYRETLIGRGAAPWHVVTAQVEAR